MYLLQLTDEPPPEVGGLHHLVGPGHDAVRGGVKLRPVDRVVAEVTEVEVPADDFLARVGQPQPSIREHGRHPVVTTGEPELEVAAGERGGR
jgi:hypothetical protein